jgi:hypothetical protein
VLRAGPLRHRPAHADQLHVDVWVDGVAVAGDAGSYRYTAPPPWGNALAQEEVHNVPRVPGAPQARRRGRFFWSAWCEAGVSRVSTGEDRALIARLQLGDGSILRRTVMAVAGVVVVLDQSSDLGAVVRWNLPLDTAFVASGGDTRCQSEGWVARFRHGGRAVTHTSNDDDPASGWVSRTYGAREAVRPVVLRVDADGWAVAAFGQNGDDAFLEVAIDVVHREAEGAPDEAGTRRLLESLRRLRVFT